MPNLGALGWSGRISRGRFAIFFIPVFVIQLVAAFGLQSLPLGAPLHLLACFGVSFALLVSVILCVRRLHDIGRSGAWAILYFVPVLAILFGLALLFLKSSDVTPQPTRRFAARFGLVAVLLIAALPLARAFYQPFWIPAGSMKPTLLIGDYLVVRPFSGDPVRGDVVVFIHPVQRTTFIKRIVGLPGDVLQMRDGILFVNDEAAIQTPDDVFRELFERQGRAGNLPLCRNVGVGLGDNCEKDRFVERFPDGTGGHVVLNARMARVDNTPIYRVPEHHVFVLGDNRDNSTDSRVAQPNGVGYVPIAKITGIATRVLFSSSGRSISAFWTWRSNRFWHKI